MCVRLCDIHSRFRRVTFKKLRSAPPIGNKSPDGMFVSPVVVATHTRTKPKKTCSNTIQHLPRQTYHSQPNTTGIHLSCTMCLCSTAQNAGRRSRTYRESEQKKKKEEHEKNYNVCMTASRSLPQGNWPPVCRLIYSDYEISALALCQTIAPQILH